ncbi:uncharacterized protein LOC129761755 isoform X1 [Toxorhynchites rutilus septentrionalis]|uniref:uncharacterized protein LOC129761755 isoform X1 n=1 Tax=Toxorhynchites rutilus septentrionalis TaxID=329112 RepID=UPI00247AC44E|nr:uncharacterized protein LOC129761755 isoform X1 [Toxorhynchites rutilus septentrionalis]
MEVSSSVECAEGMIVPQVQSPVTSRQHIETTLRSQVSSSSLTRCYSSIGINSYGAMNAGRAPLNKTAPPSIVDFPFVLSRNPLPEKHSEINQIITSRPSGCDNAIASSISKGPMLHDRLTEGSVPEVLPLHYGSSHIPTPICNPMFPTSDPSLGQNHKINNLMQNFHNIVATNPPMSFHNEGPGSLTNGYPVGSQNLAPSVTMGISRSMLSFGCQPTWSNANIISTSVAGTKGEIESVPVNQIPVLSQRRLILNVGEVPGTSNVSIPTTSNVIFLQFGTHQQPATPVRNGPSVEQMAARQVMPRDFPNFAGDPQDWPLFYSSYCNSTEACGYTDSENLARLQRCLKGSALEAVRSRLLMPQSVPYVIDVVWSTRNPDLLSPSKAADSTFSKNR